MGINDAVTNLGALQESLSTEDLSTLYCNLFEYKFPFIIESDLFLPELNSRVNVSASLHSEFDPETGYYLVRKCEFTPWNDAEFESLEPEFRVMHEVRVPVRLNITNAGHLSPDFNPYEPTTIHACVLLYDPRTNTRVIQELNPQKGYRSEQYYTEGQPNGNNSNLIGQRLNDLSALYRPVFNEISQIDPFVRLGVPFFR